MSGKNKHTVISVVGIRPDFIRMSKIFKKLDETFNHILIHTGQHYDSNLSDVFFSEFNIRKPDYNLEIGKNGNEHFHQTSELSVKIIELIRKENLEPKMILFLGDSNSVVSSITLRKEGYVIGHIEAGMRSGDKRMLEEINRTVCDHVSNVMFVYHNNYKSNLLREGIDTSLIHVVGNTIVEVITEHIPKQPKLNTHILLDIHRPENFKYKNRLENIIQYANFIGNTYNKPIYMLGFPRTKSYIKQFNINLGNIQTIDLLGFKSYINYLYNSTALISDSGTAQEEPAFLKTPTLIPRDYTERPESVSNHCSFMIDVNSVNNETWNNGLNFINNFSKFVNTDWMGDGKTSENILSILKNLL